MGAEIEETRCGLSRQTGSISATDAEMPRWGALSGVYLGNLLAQVNRRFCRDAEMPRWFRALRSTVRRRTRPPVTRCIGPARYDGSQSRCERMRALLLLL